MGHHSFRFVISIDHHVNVIRSDVSGDNAPSSILAAA
jgi:hypothetical protein